MTRSKVLIAVVSGTSALLAIIVVWVVVVGLRVVAQRDQGLKIINEALKRQKIKHQGVEYARARLTQDSGLSSDWSLEKAMTMWQSNEIEALAQTAKQFSQGQEDISADAQEKLTQFIMNSPELHELLEAIECGLCEITLDPAKGQWQISNAQIKALRAMTYMLSARAILLAEKGDNQGALKTILNSYAFMDVLLEVPNVKLQFYRPDMLLYVEYAIRRGLNPDDIPGDSKVTLLKYLERQSSKEPIVNALKLHEALVRQEVSAKHSTFIESWYLAGYHQGVERVVQSLDEPQQNVSRQWKEIINNAPFYAGQTKWRLQNVAPDALQIRTNTQQHFKYVCDFLGLRSTKR
jgi:hypothetical protein